MLSPWLKSLSLAEAGAFFLILNVVLVAASAGLWGATRLVFRSALLFETAEPIRSRDLQLVGACILLNALVSIAGFWLWRGGWLPLRETQAWWRPLVDFVLLLLVMDALMYVTHRMAHHPWLYSWLHRPHHEHIQTNALSLFVLHPAEVLGFGGLMLSTIWLVRPTEAGLTAYLAANLLTGTLGHTGAVLAPTGSRRARWLRFLGVGRFHALHHTEQQCNFGFYSAVWDRLAGTYRP